MSQYRFTKDFGDVKKGEVYIHNGHRVPVTISELLLFMGILEEVKEEEWPKVGEYYWYLYHDGDVMSARWANDSFDNSKLNFTGIYRTKEEAEKTRDDVREFIRNRNKSND